MENVMGKDNNKNMIRIGDDVLVPKPENDDKWESDFVGKVIKINDDTSIVRNGSGDAFKVKTNRVEGLPAEIYY